VIPVGDGERQRTVARVQPWEREDAREDELKQPSLEKEADKPNDNNGDDDRRPAIE
jgi:hypothetical protein